MPSPVDIVVPVFNEEASIDEFVARVDRLGYASSLVVVDNASTDGTVARLARYPSVRLIRHARNEGYGASIRDGVAAGTSELVVVIDADLEYPPEAVPRLVAALGEHAVVYGSRFLAGRPPMPLARRVGNRAVTALFNLLFGQRTTDLYTGMKGFRRRALPLEALRRPGFDHALEIAVLIALAGHHIHDVAIPYHPRRQGRSKMRHVPETLKLLALLLRYWGRGVVLGRSLERTLGGDARAVARDADHGRVSPGTRPSA
jgi:glycosyltransferase involved in cell wall biosynthesis